MENQTQPSIQPLPTDQPASQSVQSPPFEAKKGFPKWILIVLIVIFVLAVGAGAYFLGQQSVKNSPGKTQFMTQKSSPIPDATANWKTYTNSDFGFNLKYPTDWKVTTAFNPTQSPNLKLNLGLTPESSQQNSTVTPIYVSQYDNPDNLSISDWQTQYNKGKQLANNFYSPTDQETTVAGAKAYINPKGNCQPYACYQIIIMVKNNVFIFHNVNLPNEDYSNNQKIFDQILSTLKFTNQTAQVSPTPELFPNWQQYSDSKYNFSFKYPTDWSTQVKDYTQDNQRLINIIKNSSPSVVSLSFTVKDNWDNTGNAQSQTKNFSVGGVPALRVDPPKPSEQTLDRYQTNIYFQAPDGHVYVFACTHNWNQDYIDTCNNILSTFKFTK